MHSNFTHTWIIGEHMAKDELYMKIKPQYLSALLSATFSAFTLLTYYCSCTTVNLPQFALQAECRVGAWMEYQEVSDCR